jgi:hypothetical protein
MPYPLNRIGCTNTIHLKRRTARLSSQRAPHTHISSPNSDSYRSSSTEYSGIIQDVAWGPDGINPWPHSSSPAMCSLNKVTAPQIGHQQDLGNDGTSPRIIVILPGFGNCQEDYSAPFGDPSSSLSLVAALKSRGFKAYVVPLQRKDWFKVRLAMDGCLRSKRP